VPEGTAVRPGPEVTARDWRDINRGRAHPKRAGLPQKTPPRGGVLTFYA
jgi:hypothetical protein